MDGSKLAGIAGMSSIIGNVLLAGAKIYVAFACRSSAIMADAWHTLSDSLTSVIFLVGLKVSGKKADTLHPYGHGRAELIAAIIIGVLLAVVALNFTTDGVNRLLHHQPAEYGISAYVIMIVTVVVKEGMAQFAFFCARKNDLKSLRADGIHHRSDALSSLVILIGLAAGGGFWWLDGVLSIVVSLMILYSSVEVLRSAVNPLLGEPPSDELTARVEDLCHRLAGDTVEAHHFHLHTYGEHRELTFHIRLPGDWSLFRAHAMAELIQSELRHGMGIEATIHTEPLKSLEVEKNESML